MVVGSVIHVVNRNAPGRCFAAIVVAVDPGLAGHESFQALIFWPDGFVMGGMPRYFYGRVEDEGVEWHWIDSEVWHSA